MTAVALQVEMAVVRAGVVSRLSGTGANVVLAAATIADLWDAAEARPEVQPDVVIVECDESGADDAVAAVRARWPLARLVGLHSDLPSVRVAELQELGVRCLVDRSSGIDAVVAAVDQPDWPTRRRWSSPTIGPLPLTGREADVLRLISEGLIAKEIAEQLGVSVRTVEAHKQRAFAKLGVQNQAHAVAAAIKHNLLAGVAGSPR